MKHLLCVMIALSAAGGCGGKAKTEAPKPVAPIPAGNFAQQWVNPLDMGKYAVRQLHLRDDTLFIYTTENVVYAIATSGGALKYVATPDVSGGTLRAPLVLGQYVIFPCGSTIDVFNNVGRLQRTIELEKPTRSPAVGEGTTIYLGLDHPGGMGVVTSLDMSKAYHVTRWELLTFGAVTPTPALFDKVIYAGAEDGNLYAVNEDRGPAWPLEGGSFRTQGKFVSDIKADETGIYAANTDSKLYCLDRLSGRIKWQYFGSAPLETAPIVTPTMVYQYVPRTGIVAIDKITGEPFRKPKWAVSDARQFLSEDQSHAYLRRRDNRIIAVEKASGQVVFTSRTHEFEVFTSNTKDAIIYAATRAGKIIAVRPVLREGDVGHMVMDLRPEPLAAAR